MFPDRPAMRGAARFGVAAERRRPRPFLQPAHHLFAQAPARRLPGWRLSNATIAATKAVIKLSSDRDSSRPSDGATLRLMIVNGANAGVEVTLVWICQPRLFDFYRYNYGGIRVRHCLLNHLTPEFFSFPYSV
jgi:hypothetical protein